MAFTKTPAPPLAELQNLINGVAKNIVDKVYGPHGPAWGTRFSELEEVAVQVGQAISRQMLDRALQRQAAEETPVEDQVCPTCQGPLNKDDPEPRIVQTRVGDAAWKEPSTTCPRCRRAFFPSVQTPGD